MPWCQRFHTTGPRLVYLQHPFVNAHSTLMSMISHNRIETFVLAGSLVNAQYPIAGSSGYTSWHSNPGKSRLQVELDCVMCTSADDKYKWCCAQMCSCSEEMTAFVHGCFCYPSKRWHQQILNLARFSRNHSSSTRCSSCMPGQRQKASRDMSKHHSVWHLSCALGMQLSLMCKSTCRASRP